MPHAPIIPDHVPDAVRQADADHLAVELTHIEKELARRDARAKAPLPESAPTGRKSVRIPDAVSKAHSVTLGRENASKDTGIA
jgi:hypothetical protein